MRAASPHSFPFPVFAVALAIAGISFAAGCSSKPKGPKRVAVSGEVKVGGTPIEAGTIRWVPQEGTDGPAVASSISSGSYAFSRDEGPVPGQYTVRISIDPEPIGKFTKAKKKPEKTDWDVNVTVPDESSFEKKFEL